MQHARSLATGTDKLTLLAQADLAVQSFTVVLKALPVIVLVPVNLGKSMAITHATQTAYHSFRVRYIALEQVQEHSREFVLGKPLQGGGRTCCPARTRFTWVGNQNEVDPSAPIVGPGASSCVPTCEGLLAIPVKPSERVLKATARQFELRDTYVRTIRSDLPPHSRCDFFVPPNRARLTSNRVTEELARLQLPKQFFDNCAASLDTDFTALGVRGHPYRCSAFVRWREEACQKMPVRPNVKLPEVGPGVTVVLGGGGDVKVSHDDDMAASVA